MDKVQAGDRLDFGWRDQGDYVCVCWIGQMILVRAVQRGEVFLSHPDNVVLLERPRGY